MKREKTFGFDKMCLMECRNCSKADLFFFLPQAAMNVDHEVNLLVEEIHRLGSKSKYYNTDTVFLLTLPYLR